MAVKIMFSAYAQGCASLNQAQIDLAKERQDLNTALLEDQKMNGSATQGESLLKKQSGQDQANGLECGGWGQIGGGATGIGSEVAAGSYELAPDAQIKQTQKTVDRLDNWQKTIENTKPADIHATNGPAAKTSNAGKDLDAVKVHEVDPKDFEGKIADLKTKQDASRDHKDALDRLNKKVGNKRKEYQGQIDSKNQKVQSRAQNMRSYGRYAGQMGQGIGQTAQANWVNQQAQADANSKLYEFNNTTAQGTVKGINDALDVVNRTAASLLETGLGMQSSNKS